MPAWVSIAYRRTWEGAPCSKRITQGTSKLIASVPSVTENQDCAVPRLGIRDHWRSSTDKSKWGEKRIHFDDAIKAHWVDGDSAGRVSQLIEAAVLKAEKKADC